MNELSQEALRALGYSLLVGLAFAPLERLNPLRASRRSSWTTDLLFASVGHVLTRLLLATALGGSFVWVLRFSTRLGLGAASPLAEQPVWMRIIVGLLAFELLGYGYHRLAHRVPALWRLHRVHHSAPTMDWLASFRQHPVEIVCMTLTQNLPLILLGIPLGEHVTVVFILAINTVFVHSDLRTPKSLEWLIATPRFHHRHHDADAEEANYASLLPWIDRLFGTHCAADADRIGLESGEDPSFVDLMLARK